MKKAMLFLLSVFFSQVGFSINDDFNEVDSSIAGEIPMNVSVPVGQADNITQIPNALDELYDQIPYYSSERNDKSVKNVLVKNFKKQNSNMLRRTMFKKKYDRLFNEQYVALHFDPMQGGSFNININQKSDDDIEEDYNFGNDDFSPMEDIDYFAKLEDELL